MKEFTLGYSAEALVSAFWKNTIYLCSAVSVILSLTRLGSTAEI